MHYEALERFARERVAVRSVDYRWSTQDHISVDQVPYIGTLRRGSDRLYVATGFNKWGMTSGTIAGVVITDQILGRQNAWSELFDANRLKPFVSAKELVKENANVARRFVQDRVKRRRAVPVEDLGSGEGEVTSVGRKQVGVSRDAEGGTARCVGAMYAPGLHRQLERRRGVVGLPLPRLALRPGRLGPRGTRGRLAR